MRDKRGVRWVKCLVVTDDERGGVGFVPNIFRTWPNYMPSSGFGFAHDLLEHGTKETGTFAQEIAAHGGYLFVRQFGRYQNVRDVAETLASGMAFQWNETTSEFIPEAPKVKLTRSEVRKIRQFAKNYRRKLTKDWRDEDSFGDEPNPCPYTGHHEWSRLVGWLMYGFARAKRRYKNEPGTAFALFQSIESVTEKGIKRLEHLADSGVEISLRLDLENGYCSLIIPDRFDD